jgi:hypothetical protein
MKLEVVSYGEWKGGGRNAGNVPTFERKKMTKCVRMAESRTGNQDQLVNAVFGIKKSLFTARITRNPYTQNEKLIIVATSGA